jgi:PPM family protein phosphatase
VEAKVTWLVPLALLIVLLGLAVPMASRRIAGRGKPPEEADETREGDSADVEAAVTASSPVPALIRDEADTVVITGGAALRMRAVAQTFPGPAGGNADGYLIQSGMIALADGGSPVQLGAQVAALTLSAAVVARTHGPGATDEVLRRCVEYANRTVRAAAAADPRLAALASTLDCLMLEPGTSRLHYAHVGNGAIWYWPANGSARALTTPHSSGWALLRGVGMVDDLPPEVGELELAPGDRLVVATAGLSRELTQETISKLPGPREGQDACVARLADIASAAGSVVLVDFIDTLPDPAD